MVEFGRMRRIVGVDIDSCRTVALTARLWAWFGASRVIRADQQQADLSLRGY
jgi:hypothetical protein